MPTRIVVVATLLLANTLCAQTPVKQHGGNSTPAPRVTIPGTGGYSARADDRVDINAASLDQLKAVPGFADVAQKIIDGRPYRTKLDLVKRHIITRELYDKMKDRIVAHRAH